MRRGFTLVLVITPKVAAVETAVPGLLNCGWLKPLKNSPRNCSVAFSWIPPTRVLFAMEKSKLSWGGPVAIPTPELP